MSEFTFHLGPDDNHLNPGPHSAITAVMEILNYHSFPETGNFRSLQLFLSDLAVEIYNIRRKDYYHGLSAILPQIRIQSDRIYMYSPLYLEKEVPDLSSMTFKLFVEFCNMILSVALMHEMAVRGFAGQV